MDDPDSSVNNSVAAQPARDAFNLKRAFARHWRESLRYYGFWRTVRGLAASVGRAMIELLPSHRKARFGDLDFDWEHGLDTTRSKVSFRAQLAAELAGRPYFASEPWLFDEMMRALPIKFQDFTFIDLGSGKGRALLMAAPYGFRRIVGVEYMPEWHRSAEENIRKYALNCAAANRPAAAIENLFMDARDFEFPSGPLVVYLFNPFPEPGLAAVLDKLRGSVLVSQHPLFIAYRFPEYENLLAACRWLEKIAGTQQWAVYANRGIGKTKPLKHGGTE